MQIAILDDYQNVARDFAKDRVAGAAVDVFDTGIVEAIAAFMHGNSIRVITP